MKIATWNVNSIKARLGHVQNWLKDAAPDVVLLQELKCMDEAFPRMEIEELGYNVATHGQKTYNGVAILSKYPMDGITRGLPGFEDEQARYIEAEICHDDGAVRVASIYLPNGGDPDGERFPYKLAFFDRLVEYAGELFANEEMIVLGGDYNVAAEDIDVYDPKSLRGTTCFHSEEQKRFRAMNNAGWTDAWRAANPEQQQFTWWDYRGGGWQQNKGMRIDYLMCSPIAADAAAAVGVDVDERGRDKASDHVPVWVELEV